MALAPELCKIPNQGCGQATGSRVDQQRGGTQSPLAWPQRDELGQSIRQFWEGPILRNCIKQCHAGSARRGCLGWIQHLARDFSGYSCPGSFQPGPTLRWVPDTKTGWPEAHCCRRKGPARGEGGHPRSESPPWGGFCLSLQVMVLSPTQGSQGTSSTVGTG